MEVEEMQTQNLYSVFHYNPETPIRLVLKLATLCCYGQIQNFVRLPCERVLTGFMIALFFIYKEEQKFN